MAVTEVQEPYSVYELEQIVDRDFAVVLGACTSVEGTNSIYLIDLKYSK